MNRGPAALTCMTMCFRASWLPAQFLLRVLYSCCCCCCYTSTYSLLKTKRNNVRKSMRLLVCVSLYFRRERRSDTIKRIIMTIENLFVHLLRSTKKKDAFSLVIQFLKNNFKELAFKRIFFFFFF